MTILNDAVLAILLTGNTHYIDIGQDTDAVMFYESATVAHMTLPAGATFRGTWRIEADGYVVDWTDGPSGRWQIGHEAGQFTYINGDGDRIGTVTSIVPGNAAGF